MQWSSPGAGSRDASHPPHSAPCRRTARPSWARVPQARLAKDSVDVATLAFGPEARGGRLESRSGCCPAAPPAPSAASSAASAAAGDRHQQTANAAGAAAEAATVPALATRRWKETAGSSWVGPVSCQPDDPPRVPRAKSISIHIHSPTANLTSTSPPLPPPPFTRSQIVEKNAGNVKNYCVWLRYYSRSGCHNMYKEVRDTHLNGAIEKLYLEMAGKHRARTSSIQIIKTGVVANLVDKEGNMVSGKTVRRDLTKAMLDSKIKFPMSHIIQRPALAKFRSTFIAKRPSTIFG